MRKLESSDIMVLFLSELRFIPLRANRGSFRPGVGKPEFWFSYQHSMWPISEPLVLNKMIFHHCNTITRTHPAGRFQSICLLADHLPSFILATMLGNKLFPHLPA